MANLLRAELLKLKHSKSLKILIAFVIFLTLLLIVMIKVTYTSLSDMSDDITVTGDVLMNGYQSIKQIILNSQVITTCVSIFGAIFICSDFSNRTIGQVIASGHSRLSVYSSKMLAFLIGSSIIAALTPVIHVIGFTVVNGFGIEITSEVIEYMMRTMGLYLVTAIGTSSTCGMFAFLTRNVGGTIGINLVVMVVLSAFVQGTSTLNNGSADFLSCTTTYQFTKCANEILTFGEITTIILVSVCTLIITNAIALFHFTKRDLA